jgi:hypothetical protein
MLTFLMISALCLLLLLHIIRKVWENALEIHSAVNNLDTGWLEPSSPKYCHVW